jgi:thioredoxin 1
MEAPMSELKEITEDTFEAEVARAPVPVLVDFTATWCSPCRALKPLLQKIAAEGAGRLKVVTVDGDENPALAVRFGVKGFPTVIAFAGGREVARQIGLASKEKLLTLVDGHTPAARAAQ